MLNLAAWRVTSNPDHGPETTRYGVASDGLEGSGWVTGSPVRYGAVGRNRGRPAYPWVQARQLGASRQCRVGPDPVCRQCSGRSFVEDWLWPALSLPETTMRRVPVELDLSVIVSRYTPVETFVMVAA
jgi:hypothetical protein